MECGLRIADCKMWPGHRFSFLPEPYPGWNADCGLRIAECKMWLGHRFSFLREPRLECGLRISSPLHSAFRISSNVLKRKALLMSKACFYIPQSAFRTPHFLPRNPHFI